uniref:Ig-like domain-containing protein n=1 Tax=Knipowitschia caucasica TaxID=637954 RepID=A0AAV2KLT4_KNICA
MQLVQLSVLFLVQTHFCWGQYTIVTPPQVVMAPVGSDVTLPCQVEPAADLREQVVEWARLDLTPPYVHIRRDALDFHIYQNPLYLARTALSESRLQKGDLSLSLSRVKLSDEGTYRCFLPQTDTEAQVTLLVVAPPSISVEKDPSGSVVLRCESVGWSPEPELQWLDSEGTVVLRAEAQRGSDDLFSVSSRLTVQQIQGNTFTCRVQHQPSGASREARLHISDEFLKMESCSSCSLAWTLFALCLSAAAAAAALVVWKFKANKQKSENKDFELGEIEEKESMMKTPTENSHKCSPEVLQSSELTESLPELREKEKIEDELKYLEEVIHKLTETKTFLMKLKEQPQKGQYTMVTQSQVVMAPMGSDITLPCQVEPAADLREQVVEWARLDLTPPYVHIRRDGLDLLMNQNPLYLARTALSENRLQKGDLSLSLSRVKLSDEWTYRCFLPRTNTEAQVTLRVEQKSEMKDFELGEREEKEGMLRRGETIEDELKYLEEVIHKLMMSEIVQVKTAMSSEATML